MGLYFDTTHPGSSYLFTYQYGAFRSDDEQQTFHAVQLPVNSVFADPQRPGRLLGNGSGGIYESTDDGTHLDSRFTNHRNGLSCRLA